MTSRLALDSPMWAELSCAYGDGAGIPKMLSAIAEPGRSDDVEIWEALWSGLAHQGDVYSASFAAVPHIVDLAIRGPASVVNHLHMPTWIEICRQNTGQQVPPQLSAAYFDALAALPGIAVASLSENPDREPVIAAMAAIAIASGHIKLAEATLEMSGVDDTETLEWLLDR